MLPLLHDALTEVLENSRPNSDGTGLLGRCPFCGGSDEDKYSFSIKTDPDPGEPVMYICFRASCGRHGALKTQDLDELGIKDPAVESELYRWNQQVKPGFDKGFKSRQPKDYVIINLPVGNSKAKLAYINGRLGTQLKIEDLKDYKIQLSLLDMLRINDIQKLATSDYYAKTLDMHSIGFMSMYNDYLICRDISATKETGKRYFNYRISGRPEKDSLKVYSIPRIVNILDPQACEINVAEGPFSILGAYLNTDLGREKPNSIWLANCGSEYTNTIMRVCKQYGFLRVRINIWSDSEIGIGKYRKLHHEIMNRLDIRSMVVYYNALDDDFGHPASKIQVEKSTII